MGLLDIFNRSGAQQALKLKPKVTQKYGDPSTRQKAISQLGEMKVPEAVTVLLARFTLTVDPLTTDADEKEHVFSLIKAFGKEAVEPLQAFLLRSDQAASWALRLLEALVPEDEVIGTCVNTLEQLGSRYTRDPEKKVVLLHFVTGKADPRIGPAVLPLLEDMSDDVKLATLKALGPLKHPEAKEPILRLLTAEETGRRVQVAALQALHESAFPVDSYQEQVHRILVEPFQLDKTGVLQRRA